MTHSHPLKYLIVIVCCTLALQTVSAQLENELLSQLRADYTALLDASEEYEELQDGNNAGSEEQEDYAAWIQQLSEQFVETCITVWSQPAVVIPADIPCDELALAYTSPAGIDIKQETTDFEKTAAMAGQFDDSLGEFDEKLLREQDRVKARRPLNNSPDSSGGTGSGNESEGESEGGSEGESEGDSGEDSSQTSAGGTSAEGEQRGEQSQQQGRAQSNTGAQGGSSSGNQSTTPDDIPDGSDDDVIARQLREAAEKETDPELKKKLWEEYRRYKKG